jgi:5,10-methenyltetrahydromethanopterin hydrogenase
MNIFLAGIIQGSIAEEKIHPQDWRGPIQAAIAKHIPNADVYCHYTAHPNSITYDMPKIRATFDDGVERARSADMLIAWLPSASMGTAIEIFEAYQAGAVVLSISPMAANWVIRLYSDKIFPDVETLEKFLASEEFEKLLKQKKEHELHG